MDNINVNKINKLLTMKNLINNIELTILKLSLISFISTVIYMIVEYGIINYISFNGI